MSGPTVRDRAIAAVAAWLNGSDGWVENRLYVAARLLLDRVDRGALLDEALEVEEREVNG